MNTRRALPGSDLAQERWASSAAIDRGLLANLVAKRCVSLDSTNDRDLVWWLQWRSWQPGGLESVASDMLAADQLEALALVPSWANQAARLHRLGWSRAAVDSIIAGDQTLIPTREDPVAHRPEECDLVQFLTQLCGDPSRPIPAPVSSLLSRLRDGESVKAKASIAETSVVREIWAALDHFKATGSNVLIEGAARSGKTAAVRAWCNASGGRARYLPTPPGNDLDALFRAVGTAIGSAASLSFKGRQVEERIFRALAGSDLVLVFDSAWNLWPQGDIRQSHPRRLQWLLSLMEETGVGVALVTAPQWWDCRRAFIAQTGWVIEQLEGRIGRIVRLPERLTREDCFVVARSMLPTADPKIWEILGTLAERSKRRLGALESAIRDAVHLAACKGQGSPSIAEIRTVALAAVETDANLAQATGDAGQPRKVGTRAAATAKRGAGFVPAGALPSAGRTSADRLPDLSGNPSGASEPPSWERSAPSMIAEDFVRPSGVVGADIARPDGRRG